MDFLKTTSTIRICLKKLEPEDYIYIFENLSEQKIREILGLETDEAFEKEKAKFEKGYSAYNSSFVFFQMIDKDSSKIIGGIGFHNWNKEHERAELGYALYIDAFKNKGIMTEVLPVIIDYGFNKMKLHRIEAFVGTNNVPSLRLMANFNFTHEGLMRQHYNTKSKFEDSNVFSLLSKEYNQNV